MFKSSLTRLNNNIFCSNYCIFNPNYSIFNYCSNLPLHPKTSPPWPSHTHQVDKFVVIISQQVFYIITASASGAPKSNFLLSIQVSTFHQFCPSCQISRHARLSMRVYELVRRRQRISRVRLVVTFVERTDVAKEFWRAKNKGPRAMCSIWCF